jgi:hypothetical protein
MPTENHGSPPKIAPCPAVFCMTPEWHQARARFLRWLDEPKTRYWARQHENLARLIEHRAAS